MEGSSGLVSIPSLVTESGPDETSPQTEISGLARSPCKAEPAERSALNQQGHLPRRRAGSGVQTRPRRRARHISPLYPWPWQPGAQVGLLLPVHVVASSAHLSGQSVSSVGDAITPFAYLSRPSHRGLIGRAFPDARPCRIWLLLL